MKQFEFDPEHTFFTSDTHFGHANIINLCKRPFRDVNHMNDMLVENWNSVVTDDDTVFYLGDFALGGTYRKPVDAVWQLFGHVHSGPNGIGIDVDRLKYLFPTQYDVGVDNIIYTSKTYN